MGAFDQLVHRTNPCTATLLINLRWSLFCFFVCNSIEEPPAIGKIMPMVGSGVCGLTWLSWFGLVLGSGSCGVGVCAVDLKVMVEAMPQICSALGAADWLLCR